MPPLSLRWPGQTSTRSEDAKIAEDVDSADLSGISGTPTFFVNGKRHHGAYDIDTLTDAVRAARARALIRSGRQPPRTS